MLPTGAPPKPSGNRSRALLAADGRWIAVILVAAFFTALFAGAQQDSLEQSWTRLGVPPKAIASDYVLAADAVFLLATLDCHRRGFDVYLDNPCDPWSRRMNYPRIWLSLLDALRIDALAATTIAWLMTAVFLLVCLLFFGRLNFIEGFLVGLLLSSRSIMLGVERGNVDLVIFCVLGCAMLLLERGPRRLIPYALILAGAALKYFPIAALACVAREERVRAFRLGLATSAGFFLYLVVTWPDPIRIMGSIDFYLYRSYGGRVLLAICADALRDLGYAVPSSLITTAFVSAVFFIVVGAAAAAHRLPPDATNARIDGFRAGAAIYSLTYILFTNFDYKQIFVLLMVPQLFEWARRGGSVGFRATLCLWACVATFWLSSWDFLFIAGELLNLALFAYCVFELWRTRPSWLMPSREAA